MYMAASHLLLCPERAILIHLILVWFAAQIGLKCTEKSIQSGPDLGRKRLYQNRPFLVACYYGKKRETAIWEFRSDLAHKSILCLICKCVSGPRER